jgi:benzoate-CoA ligase
MATAVELDDPPDVAAPPERFNIAGHLLAINQARGAKPAFIDASGVLTYRALAERVQAASEGLKAAGLRREERVLLLMQDTSDWPVAFLGAIHAGLVPVAVNTLLPADDVAYMLEHSRSQAVLVSAALLPVLRDALRRSAGQHEVHRVWVSGQGELTATEAPFSALWQGKANDAAPAPTGRDDPAFWLYSSGSTGRPKGTVHTQANAYWTAELYGRRLLGLTEDDVCFSAAKLFFAYGLGNALTFPLSVGASVILMAERPTPDAVFAHWRGTAKGLDGVKPTVFFGAPTGYAGMLAAPGLPPKQDVALRLASSAGEALPADIGERFTQHFGVEVIDGIGSTEMLHIFLSNRPGRVRYGTTGWPVPGYRVELRGEAGAAVPDGEAGDLFIAGPSAALMYWGSRAKSRDTFQGEWTKSGDKYVKNADGSYTYSGRSDDMLKVSGIYVSPFEVEATLVQHPAVLEAAVIGVADAEGLTKSKAFVVLKPGASATEDELKLFVKDRLAPYKYPRQITFVAELPKTATGKIQRFKLRDAEARAA